MNAAKLQLKKSQVANLSTEQTGQVAGGGPIWSITYCAACFEYTYAPPNGVCRPQLSGNGCPPPGIG